MATTCLVGNGLSIAYNPQLSTGELTKGLLAAFRELGTSGGSPHPLAGFAAAIRGSDADLTFEQLLAPLESAALALPHLRRLADTTSLHPSPDAEAALVTTVTFLQDIHTRGMGTALELIAMRAKGQGQQQFDDVIVRVCRAIGELRGKGVVTVATLNYDGLLHAGFQQLEVDPVSRLDFCDLAAGYDSTMRSPAGGVELPCHGLRHDHDLPCRDVQLLNLHGSLGWLGDRGLGQAWKFSLDDLRTIGFDERSYWDFLRDGAQALEPIVVLTDRKTDAVVEWPFALAYEVFEERLHRSRWWLIAGYSFRDEPVNNALRRAMTRMVREGRTPRVLVLGRSGHPDSLARSASKTMDAPVGAVAADTTGLPEGIESEAWKQWLPA